MDNYDDIIDLERPKNTARKPMSAHDRAAQFAPFAALTGYDSAINETARLTDSKIELSEEEEQAGYAPSWSIRCKISFKDDLPPDDWRQPKIWYVTGRKKVLLDADSIACIDDAFRDQTIERVDAILSSYWWYDDRVPKDGGEPANIWKISAYVSEMWVTVRQDQLHARYDFDNDQVGDLEPELPFN